MNIIKKKSVSKKSLEACVSWSYDRAQTELDSSAQQTINFSRSVLNNKTIPVFYSCFEEFYQLVATTASVWPRRKSLSLLDKIINSIRSIFGKRSLYSRQFLWLGQPLKGQEGLVCLGADNPECFLKAQQPGTVKKSCSDPRHHDRWI